MTMKLALFSIILTQLKSLPVVARRTFSSNAASYRATPLGITSDAIVGKDNSRDQWQQPKFCPDESSEEIQLVSSSGVIKNLLRGSFLRIASDLSGGTPLENIKTRVTVGTENMQQAAKSIVDESGILGLWSGTESRTVEGALIGALFLAGSTATKKFLLNAGCPKTISSLAAGCVGGVVQALVMTPAGMIFTSLNINKQNPDAEKETALSVCKRIIQEKGIGGMYIGNGPMVMRQATNWASRAGFTEFARTQLRMSQFGLWGEVGSGIIGGVGSCWNTPIETVRVLIQRDVAANRPSKSYLEYTKDIVDEEGIPGLFRGVTPRAIQAIWQTVFMVVFPNMLGM